MKTSVARLGEVLLWAVPLLPPPPIPTPAVLGLVSRKERAKVGARKSPASVGSEQDDNGSLLSMQSFWVPVMCISS